MMTRKRNPESRGSGLPVPLTVIGGFLGAGKTSLLNHMLSAPHGRRIAVLVNDFGAINIDARQIVAVHGETISLENGCVCCTIRSDLVSAVVDLLQNEPVPEHIVVETSGVSRPLAVVESFLNGAVSGFVELQGLISVLDAELGVDGMTEYRDLALDQVRCADLVVLNKADLVSPLQCERLKQQIEDIAPNSRVWETSFGVIPMSLVLDAHSAGSRPLATAVAAGEQRAHDDHFATWVYRSPRAWSFAELQRAVEKLPPEIYRAKGQVRLALPTSDHGLFQLTGRRSWLRLCEPDSADEPAVDTELVFIGRPGCASDQSIEDVFDTAVQEQAACDRSGSGYTINELRAFEVVFA